jgi:hypothetical protein
MTPGWTWNGLSTEAEAEDGTPAPVGALAVGRLTGWVGSGRRRRTSRAPLDCAPDSSCCRWSRQALIPLRHLTPNPPWVHPTVRVRHGSPGHPCGRRSGLRRTSIRARCLSDARRVRPCSQSRAASPGTSTRTRAAPCVLLRSRPTSSALGRWLDFTLYGIRWAPAPSCHLAPRTRTTEHGSPDAGRCSRQPERYKSHATIPSFRVMVESGEKPAISAQVRSRGPETTPSTCASDCDSRGSLNRQSDSRPGTAVRISTAPACAETNARRKTARHQPRRTDGWRRSSIGDEV